MGPHRASRLPISGRGGSETSGGGCHAGNVVETAAGRKGPWSRAAVGATRKDTELRRGVARHRGEQAASLLDPREGAPVVERGLDARELHRGTREVERQQPRPLAGSDPGEPWRRTVDEGGRSTTEAVGRKRERRVLPVGAHPDAQERAA